MTDVLTDAYKSGLREAEASSLGGGSPPTSAPSAPTFWVGAEGTFGRGNLSVRPLGGLQRGPGISYF